VAWALLALPACTGLTSGENEPVAIEVIGAPDTILVNDTVPIHIRALNRSGDSIPDAPLRLFSLTPDTLGVDSARLAVIGLAPGPGWAVAAVARLSSDSFRIIVRAP
jgi:hypothetical protein